MKKILLCLATIFTSLTLFFAPVSAAGECDCPNGSGVSTTIIGGGCVCDDGKGSSVLSILNLVVDIMTIGIGILGLIGVTIVGIQYLTAGGNEEKTKKAKRRMFEIIIGLVAYVILYAALKFLLPGFNGTSITTQTQQNTQVQKPSDNDNLNQTK